MGETDVRSVLTIVGFVVATGVKSISDAGNAESDTNPTNTVR
ncbi:structural protein [Pseudomonas phage PIP]|nr:structural protein [Pseudomonas phage PIP]